jgi:hypothetical protein
VQADQAFFSISLADVQIRLILAKLVLSFDFDLDDPEWDINDWEDRSTKAFRTSLMLRASRAVVSA